MKTEGSQPVALHLDTMRRYPKNSPSLACHCTKNTKPITVPVGRYNYEITQVPGQGLLNLQLM